MKNKEVYFILVFMGCIPYAWLVTFLPPKMEYMQLISLIYQLTGLLLLVRLRNMF